MCIENDIYKYEQIESKSNFTLYTLIITASPNPAYFPIWPFCYKNKLIIKSKYKWQMNFRL